MQDHDFLLQISTSQLYIIHFVYTKSGYKKKIVYFNDKKRHLHPKTQGCKTTDKPCQHLHWLRRKYQKVLELAERPFYQSHPVHLSKKREFDIDWYVVVCVGCGGVEVAPTDANKVIAGRILSLGYLLFHVSL